MNDSSMERGPRPPVSDTEGESERPGSNKRPYKPVVRSRSRMKNWFDNKRRKNENEEEPANRSKKSSSWDVLKEKTSDAVRNWGRHEPTLEEKVLAEGVRNVPVDIRIDSQRETEVRRHETEVLRKEEKKLRDDIEAISAALAQMEQYNTEATNAEEKKKVELMAKQQDFKKNHAAKVGDLVDKHQELKQQYEKYDLQAQKIKQELDLELEKRDKVGSALKELKDAIDKVNKEMQKDARNYEKNYKEFLETVRRRREADTKDLMKYQTAKRTMQEALTERHVVRRALENKEIDERPSAPVELEEEAAPEPAVPPPVSSSRTSLELTGTQSGTLRRKARIYSDDNSQVSEVQTSEIQMMDSSQREDEEELFRHNLNRAVKVIRAMQDFSDPMTDEALVQMGYIVTDQVIRKGLASTTFKAIVEIPGYGEMEWCAKKINTKGLPGAIAGHFRKHGFKILRFLAENPLKNLCEIRDIFNMPESKVIVFEEYLTTDLETYIRSRGPLNEQSMLGFGRELAEAVDHLHRVGIAHQNISANNIFINAKHVLKLAALEYAIVYWKPEDNSVSLQRIPRSKDCTFIAPEVAAGEYYDPTTADVYSFGIMLVFMIMGRYPFDSATDEAAQDEREDANYVLHNRLGEESRDLIYRCLQKVPSNRIRMREAVVHRFFTELN